MDFTLEHLFDPDLLLIAGISIGTGTVILISWFAFGKKISPEKMIVKTTSSSSSSSTKSNKCICLDEVCKCKMGHISCYKSIPKRIKNFLLKPVNLRLPSLRMPLFVMILHPVIIRIKTAFKKKIVTEQAKVEANLHKLAKSLWDQGKYAEAERINLEILNVRRLIFGDKKT
jgi:hypothetical protein